MSLDEYDDDGPPMLVAAGDADAVPGQLDTQVEDLNLVKVPITIVTGKSSIVSRIAAYVLQATDTSLYFFDQKQSLPALI